MNWCTIGRTAGPGTRARHQQEIEKNRTTTKGSSTVRTIHRTSLLALAVAASPFLAAPAAAQPAGYWVDGRGTAVKNPNNLCWRTSYWTPALATIDCDPDLVPRPKPVAAPVPPAAPPPPKPPVAAKPAPVPVAKPKRCDATVTFQADEYFTFDKAVLARPEMRARIEAEVRKRLAECQTLEAIIVEGHTDRIGSQQVNQRLSEQRAEAAKTVLVRDLKIPADKIETLGMGKTLQIKSCPDADFKTRS
jgi:OOP family OmpA-OmpF porin